MMQHNEQMIPHLLLPLNRKKKKTQNLHNTLQLNTMEENITIINFFIFVAFESDAKILSLQLLRPRP